MSFKDMPLDTTLQKGDIVTITGPGEHDVLVREVMGVNEHTGPFVSDMASTTMRLAHLMSGLTRTLNRIQRPVPALPTVEGDYILERADGFRYVVSLRDGVWLNALGDKDDVHWLTAHVEEGSTLTRVIPADEVKRPEVDVEKVIHEYWGLSLGSWQDDFRVILRRVLEGEFDL